MKKRNIKDYKKRISVYKFDFTRYNLKYLVNNTKLHPSIRSKAASELKELVRNSSPVRLKNHCVLTGRSKSVYKRFRLSRIMLRELSLKGLIPGIKKASW